MKNIRILLFLIALLLIAPAALAQTGGQESPGAGDATATATPAAGGAALAQPIKLDTPLTISLNGTTPVSLSYKSAGSETISISARSLEAEDVLDPMLTVLDPSGTAIASNDDHRTSRTDLAPRDSLIAGLVLASAGRYTIQVAAVDAAMQGSVEVLVTSGGTATTPEQPSGDTISDRLQDNSVYSHDFTGSAGEVVTISVRATDNQLDPTVTLLDSSGSEIASNDDQTTDSTMGPYDAQIANFTLPASGTYTVQITGFAGIGGAFELSIARGGTQTIAASPTPQPTVPTEVAPTQQIVKGTVSSGEVYTYSFDATAGDVYTITVVATTSDLDPRISVYFNNNYVADNDDYGSSDPNMQSTDARIYDLIIQETGTYEIDVRGYSNTQGDFALTIDPVATHAPTGQPTEQVELGTVAPGDSYSYNFDAQAGDYVSLTARGLTTGFDPYITLLNADGTVLLDNDNEGSTFGDYAFYDARIANYHITASGTYTVEVSGVQGSSGTFGLTIGTLR